MTIDEAIKNRERCFKYLLSSKHATEENIEAVRMSIDALRFQRDAQEIKFAPCDVCRYNPPSSLGGKPCAYCPADCITD